jgi:hypothetical protein
VVYVLFTSSVYADGVNKYTLSAIAKPTVAGSFNTNEVSLSADESVHLYAYTNSNFVFKAWVDESGAIISSAQDISYTMPAKNVKLTAVYEYNPTNPANPATNYWNSQSGEIIVDDFTAGSLSTAIYNAIGDAGSNAVQSIVVSGNITSNDFGIANSFANCLNLDLSRVTGVTEVPSYAFDYTTVKTVILPATIESIGNYAFYNCSQLTSLAVYALVPPTLGYNALSRTSDDLIIYVPASAIALYQEADGWKDFTLLPITADAHVLQVNLPADASDGRYKHSSLELVNAKTGARQKYVISDRQLYTFNGLQKDEQYNVYLYSQAGLEIGRIEQITIPNEDLSVTFSDLKSLYTVSATVVDASGNDVTSGVTIEWLKPLADGSATYLRKASSLGEIPDGETLTCRVTLSDQLGATYAAPDDVTFTVTEAEHNCRVALSPFRSIVISGTVIDGDGKALAEATVTASQTLNGKYTKTYSAKTNRNGEWTLTVLDAPETELTYAASECVNQNRTIAAFDASTSALDLGTVTMKSIVGARITYGFTYQAAGSDEADTYYSDYQNVAISVYNVTQNRAHTEVSQQYPLLAILDENIHTNDELQLTATSKTGAFNPIVNNVTVNENQRGEVTFVIVGKGGIKATFESTDNTAVVAMLYSAQGELLKKSTYSEAAVTFSELEDGTYTLITMGQSDLMNSTLRLSNLAEIGLREGSDYVKNTVNVESGVLATVQNSTIPAFDESVFYFTNSSANFSVNKSSITTGNYLTLRSTIDFKDVYKNGITNVALVVDLPDACDFVEQSVIQGPNLLPYTIDNHRLTVQLGNSYTAQTRFCVVPTTGGTFNASAAITFDYNGKTVTQPIGSATSEIKDIEINVPNIIASNEFVVTGTASPKSKVEVYSNESLIGACVANANGTWSANCVLVEPVKLSSINVHAKIQTPDQHILVTENTEVYYDPEAIMPTTVTMTFWNGYYKKQYEVIWDIAAGTCNASKYDFYTTTDITFLLRFTTTEPDKIRNLVLNVFTSSGKVKKLVPIYSNEYKCWVAMESFSSSSLPTNVSVDYELNGTSRFDSDFLSNNLNPATSILNEFGDNKEWLSSTIESLNSATTEEEEDRIIEEILSRYNINITDNDREMSEDSISIKLSQIDDYPDYLTNLLSASPWNEAVNDYTDGIEIKTCDNLTAEILQEQGFSIIEKTDGNYCYYLSDGTTWQFVDFESDIYIIVNTQSRSNIANLLRSRNSDSAEEWIDKLEDVSTQIKDLVGGIYDYLNTCNDNLKKAAETVEDELEELYIERRWLKKNSNNAWLKGEIKFKIAAKTKVLEGLKSTSKWLNNNFKAYMSSGSKIAKGTFSFAALTFDCIDAINEVKDLIKLRDSLTPPCTAAENAVQKLKDSANRWAIGAGAYYFGKLYCDVAEIGGVTSGIAALIPSGGTSTSAILAAIAVMTANIAADYAYKGLVEGFKNRTEKAYQKAQELCKTKNPKPEDFPDGNDENPLPNDNSDTNPDHYSTPTQPTTTPTNPVLDPSGYVYEAVPENRVEGVQATIYYKETVEDMYGDPYENIVLWDAEEYAQKNPLFTDENGMYRWDVPQGLWQVKFEKDGYVTAYSEWLPVPPPQLDVNIAIVQNKQPEVIDARAYEEGVEVQFDKFMDLSTLTNDNIYVTANDRKLTGTIRMIDSALADEYATEEDADATHYASRVRFVPNEALSSTTGEIRVTVSRNVRSYAGIPMTEAYSQVLDVEKEVQYITADNVEVLYGGEKQLTIYALPYEAAVGRTLRIATASELITSIDKTEVTLDEEGKATITVKGNLPGYTQLTFSIDDVTATGECAVEVVTALTTAQAPVASRASGTAVYRGTKIELSTATQDGVIYYTTDGSCPCDENGSRRQYTEAIVIDEDTQILAMTVAGDNNVSEVVEFNYTLKRSEMDFALSEGWTWISHSFESPVNVATLAADSAILTVKSKSQEATRNTQSAMTGTLQELKASESYKVETNAATSRLRLSDIAWNPATPITLTSGWNWLGYPVSQTMSVNEAFALTAAENLDVIVGQNGFAQFDGENWIGTLDILSPGLGYMYVSQSPKEVVYNTTIVSNASALRAAGIARNATLAVDVHKYPSVMPVVATLLSSDSLRLSNTNYQVYAFCGTECRGIGRVVNDLVMMNVYGNDGDVITFRVTYRDGSAQYDNRAELTFGEKVIGTLASPYNIILDNQTGIDNATYEGNVSVRIVDGSLLIKGIATTDINLVEIFDVAGHKLIHETTVPDSGIRVSQLSVGVYVVVVNGNNSYTYHKIVIR